jgi:hypothetical protein
VFLRENEHELKASVLQSKDRARQHNMQIW